LDTCGKCELCDRKGNVIDDGKTLFTLTEIAFYNKYLDTIDGITTSTVMPINLGNPI
jgi:hypothetical protein